MAEYSPSKIIKDGNTYNFRDTTKIPLAGSNQISGSLIPATTDAYDLGGSSYQWNNAYIKSLTINGVACGDILTHNVSEFVDVTSAQTIGGVKKFSDTPIVVNGKTYVSQINASRANGTQAGFSAHNGFKIVCNNDSQGWDNTAFAIHVSEYSPTSAAITFKLYDCIEGSVSYKGFLFRKNNNDFQFSPTASNLTDLGTSTNKWKSFNGINPGALSLPGSYISIDTTNWILDGSNVNAFTPTSDGWLGIQATDTVYDQMHYIFAGRIGSALLYQQNVLSPINALWGGAYHGCIFIPILKNANYHIRCVCESVVATFYPCRGNV